MATTTVTSTRDSVAVSTPGGLHNGLDTGLYNGLGGGNFPPPRPTGGGNNGPRGRQPGDVPERFRVGVWALLVAITMMFLALTGVYIIRAVGSGSWQALHIPPASWVSTFLLLASSATIEVARRALKRNAFETYRRWLLITLGCGAGFIAAQLLAWRELAAQGVYLSSHPHSSFFYLLTAAHALHMLGGIGGLLYLLRKTQSSARTSRNKIAMTDAVTVYWHFMDGLWCYLFVLLFLWK